MDFTKGHKLYLRSTVGLPMPQAYRKVSGTTRFYNFVEIHWYYKI